MMDEALPKADSVQFVMKCYTKLIISGGWNMKLDIFDLSGKVFAHVETPEVDTSF